jgi:hypothetical protein
MARSATCEKLRAERLGLVLVSAGWILRKDGWMHPHLNGGLWPWPAQHAARLQRETDEGMQDEVHRMLRGET